MAPYNWWKEVALVDEPVLAKMCIRILQIGISSSVNERVFSGWKHIMGEKRTRMGKKRQLKQVCVYTNRRVMKRYKTDLFVKCDSAVETSSDEEEEATAASPLVVN